MRRLDCGCDNWGNGKIALCDAHARSKLDVPLPAQLCAMTDPELRAVILWALDRLGSDRLLGVAVNAVSQVESRRRERLP